MRYYTLDENGIPMTTDNDAIVAEWLRKDNIIFDTQENLMISTSCPDEPIQEVK